MASQQTKDNLIAWVENMSSIFPNCLSIYLHRSFLPLALKNSNRIAFSLIISRNNEYSYCMYTIWSSSPNKKENQCQKGTQVEQKFSSHNPSRLHMLVSKVQSLQLVTGIVSLYILLARMWNSGINNMALLHKFESLRLLIKSKGADLVY